MYWNLYAAPRDARKELEIFHERYHPARPHGAWVAAEPQIAPARILTPQEVYVRGGKLNPPPGSRWVGWLEKDPKPEALPPHKTAERISAYNLWQDKSSTPPSPFRSPASGFSVITRTEPAFKPRGVSLV